jgi:YEATS domain-containing protein 4
VVEGTYGKPFLVRETGWGEFEITMKFYFVPESGEKPQPYYHHLRLHPYGKTEAEQEASRGPKGEIRSWTYEELLFNEPYESFYDTLTTGAHPKGHPMPTGGKGKGKGKGGKPLPPLPDKDADTVWERSALIPKTARPDQPFCSATEELESKRLQAALEKVTAMSKEMMREIKEKEDELKRLRDESTAAVSGGGS